MESLEGINGGFSYGDDPNINADDYPPWARNNAAKFLRPLKAELYKYRGYFSKEAFVNIN